MEKLRISLFKDSYDSFVKLLDENGIEYNKIHHPPGTILASGTTIEIISKIASITPWRTLANTIIAWLGTRKSRKVIITTKNNEVFHIEGYSASEVNSILSEAKNIVAFDPPEKVD